MEFPGIGKGRTGRALKDTRGALEQAESGNQVPRLATTLSKPAWWAIRASV